MKKLLTAILVMATLTAGALSKISEVARIETETISLGKMVQNVPATATFIITNTSKQPIIIEKASPTCGCTVADFTKTPIAPGKTGIVKATYNAATLGSVNKTIFLKLNGVEEVKELHITGEVVAKS